MSGGARAFTGAFRGTGADIDLKTVPFRPHRVQLMNLDSADQGQWQQGMDDGSMLKTLAAGASSLVTGGNGITPLSQGFRLGADADLNVVGEEVHFTAWE